MSTRPSSNPLRILLVEDSIDEAFLLRSILEARGHLVRTAQDGGTALDLWDGGEYDVVVTDLNLPGMDGVALARALRAPGRDAVVIAVTGYTRTKYVESARHAGVDHILSKPIDAGELVATVEASAASPPEPRSEGGRPRPASGATVLVVAARPGDATFGCGATMVRHRAAGDDVVVHLVDAGPADGVGRSCAIAAAEALGVRLRIGGAGDGDAEVGDDEGEGRGAERSDASSADTLERVVAEVGPDVVYIPSRAEHDAPRRDIHGWGRTAAADVPAVLGYLTPTSSLEFRPDSLKVVTRQMSAKLDAVLAFAEMGDPALSRRFVQATARWWGRGNGFSEVEPFEHLHR